ncbi:MAG: hypothetical protein JNM42_06695 [Propionivibrio sp.]|uniref:hypothetical protein n=1 Tax=Propionivibrio sp. TaxID=2212460 RepID=UPI001A5F4D70|nr:hypothetical protein [Propionivibrio sp.]MBL8414107.1 hypothetical protein [Propionivibrio sp.]
MRWLGGFLLLCALTAGAAERISVCFNYGCLTQTEVVFSDEQLRELGLLLGEAQDAAQERAAISVAVGRLLGWAGEQSPISADRGGNYADDAVYGRMDCIDHSTTTTRLLRMMESQGMLRYNRVLEPVLRHRLLIFDHFAALIEESEQAAPAAEGAPPGRYVVDSWFFDNGQPAAVMPLANWQAGESPNGSE